MNIKERLEEAQYVDGYVLNYRDYRAIKEYFKLQEEIHLNEIKVLLYQVGGLQKKLDRIGEIVKEHRDYYVIKSLVEEILKK